MTKTVEFLFDVGSPTAYLAYRRLPGIVERTAATVIWTPILLGGVFKATGNGPPGSVQAKGAWMARDMARYAARFGLPLRMNPNFPVNTLMLMRTASGLRGTERFAPFVEAVFVAMWERTVNLSDPGEVAAMLAAAGFDPAEIGALAERDDVKAGLKASTDDAIARGVFGAPSFFVDGELFFGQDRLDFVEDELAA